jgi:hypothetical protein
MFRIIVLVLCAFACSAAVARGRVAPRSDVNAEARGDVGAYPQAERAAPVTRYRARQDIAASDYLGAAMDDGSYDSSSNDNSGGNGNGGGNGGGNPYAGGGYGGGGSYGGGGGGGAPSAPMPAMSFSGTVHGSYGGGGGHDGDGCVYKGVMTDAEIATCKAASLAWMSRSGKK